MEMYSMENMMNKYSLQSVPNGYRIVTSNGDNCYPIFETFPPLNEEMLNKIISALEESYEQGHADAWRECCNKLGIIVDY